MNIKGKKDFFENKLDKIQYVDLGLSVLWADRNVGAESPIDYGNYFDWNDVKRNKFICPTIESIYELVNDCKWEWITTDGVSGYNVIGKNGNNIFLPASGVFYEEIDTVLGLNKESAYFSCASIYYFDSPYTLNINSERYGLESQFDYVCSSVRLVRPYFD